MIIKLKACIVSESELDQCCADYLVRMSSFLCIHLNPLPSKSNNYWCVPFCVQSWGPVVRKCVYIPQRYTASYSISSNSLNVLAIQNPGDWDIPSTLTQHHNSIQQDSFVSHMHAKLFLWRQGRGACWRTLLATGRCSPGWTGWCFYLYLKYVDQNTR